MDAGFRSARRGFLLVLTSLITSRKPPPLPSEGRSVRPPSDHPPLHRRLRGVTDQPPMVYGVKDFAEALGVGMTSARDWLATYEEVAGKFPRPSDKANAPRVISQEALEAIRTARETVLAHPGTITAADALRRALGLEVAPPSAPSDGLATLTPLTLAELLRDPLMPIVRDAVRAELEGWESSQESAEAIEAAVAAAVTPLARKVDELAEQNRLLLEALAEAQERDEREKREALATRTTPRKGLLARLLGR
jgi:hypothetical protein